MKIWTVWLEHKTEGKTSSMAGVFSALDEHDAKNKFKEKFGDFYASLSEVKEGIPNNLIVTNLLSDHIMTTVFDNKKVDLHIKLDYDN